MVMALAKPQAQEEVGITPQLTTESVAKGSGKGKTKEAVPQSGL